MNESFYARQADWVERAEHMRPDIHRTTVHPMRQIEMEPNAAAWQGIAVRDAGPADESLNRWFQTRTIRLDFGRHLVGYVELELEVDRPIDSPLRLDLKFAETPYELATDFATYHGHLDGSWLQQYLRIFDTAPCAMMRLERRYAFRYLEITTGAPSYRTRIKQLRVVDETSAGNSLPPPENLSVRERAIDRVSLETMRGCMQQVFEDGPKRDRRLWLGDMWLQAKVNAFTFRHFGLIERSLYMICGKADSEGLIPGAVLVWDGGEARSCNVMTYALLLGPMLRDHLAFSGNEAFCRELLPVALRQQEIFRKQIDTEGVLHSKSDWWLFIDHVPKLKRETAALGVYIYSLRETAALLRALKLPYEALLAEAEQLSLAIRRRCWDPERKLMLSDGPERQFAWATQAWLILAGVPTEEQAHAMWQAVWSDPEAIRPVTPFLWSTVLEAGWALGEYEKVRAFILEYWGGMVDRGADTFWEVYVPETPLFSSYGDPLMNSACHAWSCIPGYFLRSLYAHKNEEEKPLCSVKN